MSFPGQNYQQQHQQGSNYGSGYGSSQPYQQGGYEAPGQGGYNPNNNGYGVPQGAPPNWNNAPQYGGQQGGYPPPQQQQGPPQGYAAPHAPPTGAQSVKHLTILSQAELMTVRRWRHAVPILRLAR